MSQIRLNAKESMRFLAAALTVGLMAMPLDVAAQTTAETPPAAPALEWDPNDPRIGLGAGWMDAESAISGMELLAAIPRPEGFFNPSTPADGRFSNTALAFTPHLLLQRHSTAFQIF